MQIINFHQKIKESLSTRVSTWSDAIFFINHVLLWTTSKSTQEANVYW